MDDTPRTIPLDAVQADGWLEQFGRNSPEFPQVRGIVGDCFFALSLSAGVRITSVIANPRTADASLVDFVIGSDPVEQRLPLGEFRRRLAAAFSEDEPAGFDLGARPSEDELQTFLGSHNVLLAPIFGITLIELRLTRHGPNVIRVRYEEKDQELSLDEFRATIRELIRAELQSAERAGGFSIDFDHVAEAIGAEKRGEHERIIELLGAWPGPLSMLLRTPDGQALSAENKGNLARALGLLGTAYAKQNRLPWAEEILRLGIQWGQESPVAAELFRRLADVHLAQGKAGEAIGLLRRALTLGAEKREILPALARAYSMRGKHVAAMVCADEARAAGVGVDALAEVQRISGGVLGEAWSRFRARVPAVDPVRETAFPPKRES